MFDFGKAKEYINDMFERIEITASCTSLIGFMLIYSRAILYGKYVI